jgi:translocator protein
MSKNNLILTSFLFTGIMFIHGLIGKLLMGDSGQSLWYISLQKPFFNPPGYIFAIVWPILYCCIIATGIQLSKTDKGSLFNTNLILLFGHLPINTLWIYLFFIQHNKGLAVLLLLILSIIVWGLAVRFKEHNLTAALLFLPYCLWLTFAFILNITIYILNN